MYKTNRWVNATRLSNTPLGIDVISVEYKSLVERTKPNRVSVGEQTAVCPHPPQIGRAHV